MSSSSKQILRQQIRQLLRSISADDRVDQSKRLTKMLLHHPKYISAKSISIYVHMENEVSTRDVMNDAFQSKKTVFIPRYYQESNQMEMVRIYSLEDLDSLPMTKWKIRQPSSADQTREVARGNLDLIIVPGLAFSLDGSRLGHGKGYYDRYLHSLTGEFYTIALAFRQQIVENNKIPMSSNDVPLREILVVDSN